MSITLSTPSLNLLTDKQVRRQIYNRAYYELHRERLKARQRERNVASREAKKAYNRAYYEANKAQLIRAERRRYAASTEERRAAARRWRAEHPELIRVQTQIARARKAAAPGRSTAAQLEERWNYYAAKCWMCGDVAASWDHVVPLSRGGSNWASNLRPACLSCNSRKNNKLVRECPWLSR